MLALFLFPEQFAGNLETHREPDHYVLMAVAFGDRSSGAIAALALRQTATMCFCLKRISTAIKAFIIFDPFAQ
jgi:hypothetical protein